MNPLFYIESDINRYYIQDVDRITSIINAFQGISFSVVYRTVRFLYVTLRSTRFSIVAQFLNFIYKNITSIFMGFEIEIQTDIGQGMFLTHRGIIIGARKLGKNISIFGPVTIGRAISIKNNKIYATEGPTIGNDVTIFTGARIIGPIKIGNNVVIGANAVVVNNVKSNVVIGGVPARIIKDL